MIGQWTLVKTLDISELENRFGGLIKTYVNIKNLLDNTQNSTAEIHNYRNSTDNSIGDQFDRLFPKTHKRNKKGLLNSLGSITKAITRNLDQYDAEKYDKAIEQLSNNQQKIEKSTIDQISLMTQAIHKFNVSIHTLVHNQKEIENRVNELCRAIEQQHLKEYILVLADTVYNQLYLTFISIKQILNTLENAITFAKLNVLHPSII